MLGVLRGLIDRMKALFISTVALDCEARFFAGQAERKAKQLRRAAEYEQKGLRTVAHVLRSQAEAMSLERPLATILPALGYLEPNAEHLLPHVDTSGKSSSASTTKKKGGRG